MGANRRHRPGLGALLAAVSSESVPICAMGTNRELATESSESVRVPSRRLVGCAGIRSIAGLRQLRIRSVYGCARIFTVDHTKLCE